MTIASRELFELCKQVYEATGWETPDWWGKSAYSGEYRVVPDKQYEVKVFADEGDAGRFYDHLPHYTSDYLLEKLPKKYNNGILLLAITNSTQWGAEYYSFYPPERGAKTDVYISDTPLKALLKLTIALSEAGELK